MENLNLDLYQTEHNKGVEIAKDLWYSFIEAHLKEQLNDEQYNRIIDRDEATAILAKRMLSRDRGYNKKTKIVKHPVTTFQLIGHAYRKYFLSKNRQKSCSTPPTLDTHTLSDEIKEQIESESPVDFESLRKKGQPSSWLYRGGSKQAIEAFITVDSMYIREHIESLYRNVNEQNAIVFRLVLKELFHFIMHWDNIYRQPATPQSNFEARWADSRQEQEAWVASNTFISIALAAISHYSRENGNFDSTWIYP